MRRNLHFVVPRLSLRLIEDEAGGDHGCSQLAEYRWGSGVARHLFCARCGISPFYTPRSNPDGWAVTFQCLDAGTVEDVEVRFFDGQHWEDFIEAGGAAIKGFSEPGGGGGGGGEKRRRMAAEAVAAAAAAEAAAAPRRQRRRRRRRRRRRGGSGPTARRRRRPSRSARSRQAS